MKLFEGIFKGKKGTADHDQVKSDKGNETRGDKVHGHQATGETKKNGLEFRCPMGCEGDKTYESPGKCPVCKMDLILVTDHGSEH